MLIKNLIGGPHQVEFGKNRETVYHFRHLRHDPVTKLADPTSPIVADIKDREHAKRLLASPERYEPYLPGEDANEKAEADAILKEVVAESGTAKDDTGATLPLVDMTDDDNEEAISIELRIPKAAYQAILDGSHRIEINPREENMSVEAQPMVMAVNDPTLEALLESGSLAQLRAYCTANKIKHNLKQDEATLRSMIRERALLPETQAA